ncbi:hypothetical protein ACSSS7_006459 [Eimeria intestinalis]
MAEEVDYAVSWATGGVQKHMETIRTSVHVKCVLLKVVKLVQQIFEESCRREAAGGDLTHLKKDSTDEVRTDTLRLNWGYPERSGMKNHRAWQNLVSAEGNVCVLKWDAMSRVRCFRYLGSRPLQLLGLQQLLSLPSTFLNKINGKVHAGQSLRASKLRHERSAIPRDPLSCEEETKEKDTCMAPVGASWSAQRKRLQLQLNVDEAENTLHPILVHDVQRQLIDYLRHMQQTQDRNDLLRHYYIPSNASVEAGSKLRLERIAKG